MINRFLNADPRISSCVITWNGCEEDVVVPVPENRNVKEPLSTIINLPEGKYIFNMITRSDTGKESLARNIAGEVYGSNYQAGLSAQSINSMAADLNGVTILWSPVDGCTETTLTYKKRVIATNITALRRKRQQTPLENRIYVNKFDSPAAFY
ncbi:DUF4998 domain-containing protein [uncultured Bacteroides sp.]|uniref:DUF4998 domain-containing protein n=1 Tax=uncultured Bacteroides sp. TaxID=162156 RepID=UPI0025EFD992|nr:DUF4998 domain-containing protein [uncultured Bacteroides sp.]